MMEYAPGDIAPTTGRYELITVLGARNGRAEYVMEGDPLPAAPRRYTWRLVEGDG